MTASWKQLFFQMLLLVASCRRINTNSSTPTKEPLLPTPTLSTDVKSIVLKGDSLTETVELLKPVKLLLECKWTGNEEKLPNITGFWTKDGTEILDSRRSVQWENEQYNLKQMFTIDSEGDLGNYSCVFGNEASSNFILSVPQIGEVRDKPVVSYVRDFVALQCKMKETKPQPTTWIWFKGNATDKERIFPAENRYVIENVNNKTRLVVHNLTEADGGFYYCGAVYAIGTTLGCVELRVITMLEPLKPFIAILVVVIVLVTAILLYERIQSKEKNAAENGMSTDQTNSLPHGEENGPEGHSSVRQRKV
ncbi:embigin [Mugil cephalus]|uniref:embigin n=1 Tax=Mugil cephalus TaxID=48193 RepID=UPI001FB75136|nr:embigin [Mugil cephalus]